tara:strand:- start:53783 stop:54631 length:849 start_codon:yes stop_codon:yes gene_type:complete
MRDLNSIVSANADSFIPQQTVKITVGQLEALHKALGTATASLVDVLKYGTNRNQRKNINNSDLPIIGKATELAAGLLAQVEKGFVGSFKITDPQGNVTDLGPGIVSVDMSMENRLDRPLTGADSPYAEDRAQARFDAIEDARVSAKAQEAAQEAADREQSYEGRCATSPLDSLTATRRPTGNAIKVRIMEDGDSKFIDLSADNVAELIEWLDSVIEHADLGEDYQGEIDDLRFSGQTNFIGTSYGYDGRVDLIIRDGAETNSQSWVTFNYCEVEVFLEFLNA